VTLARVRLSDEVFDCFQHDSPSGPGLHHTPSGISTRSENSEARSAPLVVARAIRRVDAASCMAPHTFVRVTAAGRASGSSTPCIEPKRFAYTQVNSAPSRKICDE